LFAWMLFSHKACRWLAPWAAVLGLIGVLALAPFDARAAVVAVGAVLLGAFALIAWRWPEGRTLPRIFSMPAFLVAGNVAVLHAALKALKGERHAVWEPTRRDAPHAAPLIPSEQHLISTSDRA